MSSADCYHSIKIKNCKRDEIGKFSAYQYESNFSEDIFSWKSQVGFSAIRSENKSVYHLQGENVVLSNFAVLHERKYLLAEGLSYKDFLRRLSISDEGVYDGLNVFGSVEYIDEPTILIGGQNNYCHLLTNWLPRLELAKHCIPNWQEMKILIHHECSRWVLDILKLFGVDEKSIIYRSKGKDIRVFKNLYVPTMYENAEYSRQGINMVASRILSGANLATPEINGSGERIYITRKDANVAADRDWIFRDCVNEDEVLECLKPMGFVPYRLSDLSFSDQVKLFSNADIVIGAHGAGLTNLMFSSPKTKYIVLNNASPSPTYLLFRDLMGLKGVSMKCETVTPMHTTIHPKEHPFRVDLKKLVDTLATLGL